MFGVAGVLSARPSCWIPHHVTMSVWVLLGRVARSGKRIFLKNRCYLGSSQTRKKVARRLKSREQSDGSPSLLRTRIWGENALSTSGMVGICLHNCDLKKKKPKYVWPVGWGSRLKLSPELSIPETPAVSLGERDECAAHWQIWAALARLYFTFMPTELPSAFGMGKFRHQSGLSKKFQFHDFSPRRRHADRFCPRDDQWADRGFLATL